MSKAKKTERVNLYNKGRRTWPLVDGGRKEGEQNVELRPGKSIELDKVLADRMIKNYPGDFILGNKPEAKADPKVKALTKKVEDLEKDKADLIKINEEMEKNIEELTAKVEELSKAGE